jgi:putative DNA primase/helicase
MLAKASEIHAAVDWPEVLERLGVAAEHLRNRHGPCPMCGGKDRYRFDNRDGRGTWICNGCGAGDGFKLVQLFLGCDFRAARDRVIEAAGLGRDLPPTVPREPQAQRIVRPSGRVDRILSTCTRPELVPDVVAYLDSRSLWPLPDGCTLRAHAAVDYFADGKRTGRYPALVAAVLDVAGELVTAHVTHLEHGKKAPVDAPRKLLGPLGDRDGCAVRLLPAGDVLGVGEGIETSLAAHWLHGLPVWACLNASVLAKFEPPPEVRQVVIFADRDVAGLEAALSLTARLSRRFAVETRLPKRGKDFAEDLEARS